jgi:hypothetical protein
MRADAAASAPLTPTGGPAAWQPTAGLVRAVARLLRALAANPDCAKTEPPAKRPAARGASP